VHGNFDRVAGIYVKAMKPRCGQPCEDSAWEAAVPRLE
jgi:hypothetical protein